MSRFIKDFLLVFAVLVFILAGCSSGSSSVNDTNSSNKGVHSENATEARNTDYPKKTIRLIVPWAAGGDTDAIFRLVAEGLEKELGQTVVVKNVDGGAGTVGAQKVLNSDSDGYTLLAGHDSIALSHLLGKVDFGYFDFEPVSLMTSTYDTVATHPDNPWDNMKDVIKDAKENPGKISFAASIGSTTQLQPALIQTAADIKFNIVGYDGTAKRMQAVAGNHVDLGGVSVVAGTEYLKADKMKLLGFFGPERSDVLPDVPTLLEQGIDVVAATNRGIFVPKGTPDEIVRVLSDALGAVASSDKFGQKMSDLGTEVNYKSHNDYVKFLKQNHNDMKEALKKAGMLNQ